MSGFGLDLASIAISRMHKGLKSMQVFEKNEKKLFLKAWFKGFVAWIERNGNVFKIMVSKDLLFAGQMVSCPVDWCCGIQERCRCSVACGLVTAILLDSVSQVVLCLGRVCAR